ncbi:MAG: glycerophosphodiester phosphodiesterase family protein [Verrucomicrobiia bacterium]
MKITILLILTILAPSLPAVEIIAHRGASHDAPENTLAAVNLAWKRNADAVEIDVYLSRDKKIVVIHDQDTARTTGHRGLVHRQTWAQLRKLDAGAWKAPQWKSEPIPSLEQVLKTIPKSKRLFIEIKCGPEIVPPLAILLAKTKTPAAQTAIIAFSLEVCTAAKKRLPALEVFYLKHLKQNPETAQWPAIAPTLAAAKTAQLDGINIGFKGQTHTPAFARYLRQIRTQTRHQKLSLYAWTINTPTQARQLITTGFQGITTDRPGFIRHQLKKP